jgi:pyruvate kinase
LLVRGDHDGGTVQSLQTIQAQLDELLAELDRAESEHAEAIALVASGADVGHVLDRLAASSGRDLGLILTIETRQGFENLPSILLEGMRHPRLAVMIARGDLAVEVGFERLSAEVRPRCHSERPALVHRRGHAGPRGHGQDRWLTRQR